MEYSVISSFKEASPKKKIHGQYRIEGNTLKYVAQSSNDAKAIKLEEFKELYKSKNGVGKFYDYNGKVITPETWVKGDNYARIRYSFTESNVVAHKIVRDGKTILLGNGSILPLIGRKVSYGNVSNNRSETEIQKIMRRSLFVMLPFSVFEAAKLNIDNYSPIDQGLEEKFMIKEEKYNNRTYKTETVTLERHFVGASLFEVDGKYFLFDVDRREIKHKIFNPFLVELKKKCATIAEAYESLKPKAVKDAEKKGLKVLRQGEWFFIPTKAPKLPKLTQALQVQAMFELMKQNAWGWRNNKQFDFVINGMTDKKILNTIPNRINIKAGNNRPNTVEMGLTQNGLTYCTGKVTHSGREHAPLILKQWYTVHANTSVGSFTLTGDVD